MGLGAGACAGQPHSSLAAPSITRRPCRASVRWKCSAPVFIKHVCRPVGPTRRPVPSLDGYPWEIDGKGMAVMNESTWSGRLTYARLSLSHFNECRDHSLTGGSDGSVATDSCLYCFSWRCQQRAATHRGGDSCVGPPYGPPLRSDAGAADVGNNSRRSELRRHASAGVMLRRIQPFSIFVESSGTDAYQPTDPAKQERS